MKLRSKCTFVEKKGSETVSHPPGVVREFDDELAKRKLESGLWVAADAPDGPPANPGAVVETAALPEDPEAKKAKAK